MTKFGFSLQTSYSVPMPDVISMLADAGFNALSPVSAEETDLAEIANAAAVRGLELQSLHGMHRGIPNMWCEAASRHGRILDALLKGVEDCAAFGIPTMVVHPWCGFEYDFSADTLFFGAFDALAEHAEKHSVRIAFENLEGPEFLAALLDRYRGLDCVGFCWDSGHELCYAPDTDFLALYGGRLIMTHLNDNFGRTRADRVLQASDDLHLIPRDGAADWEGNIRRLKKAQRQEILNFELKIKSGSGRGENLYSAMAYEDYFAKAYDRARRVTAEYFE